MTGAELERGTGAGGRWLGRAAHQAASREQAK
jgi:hypothetical protein